MASRLRRSVGQGRLFGIAGADGRALPESVKADISLMISEHADQLERFFTSAKEVSFAEFAQKEHDILVKCMLGTAPRSAHNYAVRFGTAFRGGLKQMLFASEDEFRSTESIGIPLEISMKVREALEWHLCDQAKRGKDPSAMMDWCAFRDRDELNQKKLLREIREFDWFARC